MLDLVRNDAAVPLNDLASTRAWADAYILLHPKPDFHVGPPDDHQLQRWYVAPRNPVSNCYLHRFLRSDDARALHDHPWDYTTWLLSGEYVEHLEDGSTVTRFSGDVISHKAAQAHRVELITGPVTTMFFTGPIYREWGFWCGPVRDGLAVGSRFVPWQDFVKTTPGGNQQGRGCGE